MLAPQTIRFCPLCAGALGREAVPPDQREQAVCSRCRFVFYLNPKVVAGTIPEQDGRILLTRRSINPGRGLWTFPGGFVDFGETVTDAAMRETFEETGLNVDLTGLLNVYTYPAAPVIIVYKARVIGGTLTTCDENDALEWVTPERIPWVVLGRLADDTPAAGHDVLQPDERGEPDAQLPDGAGARPVRHGLADESHRQHPVGEDPAHAGGAGELVILMDGVEIAGRARVARELDLRDRTLDEWRQLVAHLDV